METITDLMFFSDFKNSIPIIQKARLGGIKEQFHLAPNDRKRYDSSIIKANNPTKASVLIIFFPNSVGQTSFVLTKRADYDGHHSKQISFPGGKQDINDPDLLTTALRETHEEIGLTIKPEAIFKKLTEVYIPPSNFIVEPYLALLNHEPHFTTNYEVDALITPKLSDILQHKNQKITHVEASNGKIIETPYFALNNEIVWGATAMMLSELRHLILKIQ